MHGQKKLQNTFTLSSCVCVCVFDKNEYMILLIYPFTLQINPTFFANCKFGISISREQMHVNLLYVFGKVRHFTGLYYFCRSANFNSEVFVV